MNLQPALDLIKEFEGIRLKAYKCPAGVWTIGYGTTVYPNGKRVKAGDRCGVKEAEAFLMHDLRTVRIPAIEQALKVEVTDNEMGALISFCYNVGNRALAKSTLMKKLNAQRPDEEIVAEFMKWTKAGGKVLKGLVRRRKAEAAVFTG